MTDAVEDPSNLRKLVTFRKISALLPIDGADAIELAQVDGWQVVVKRGEFKPGDACIYFEIDSFLPDGNPAWQFLVDKQPRMFNGVKGHKLRTIKLRGALSQGFLLKPEMLPEITQLVADSEALGLNTRECDLSAFVGVVKFEAPLPACLQGTAKGLFPSFLRKTDQERCQNLVAKIFGYESVKYSPCDWISVETALPAIGQVISLKGPVDLPDFYSTYTGDEQLMTHWKPVEIRPPFSSPTDVYERSLKLDGSSMTAYVREVDGVVETGVCSRNLELKISEENKDNSFIRAFFDLGIQAALLECMRRTGYAIALQGELMGPGIQGNREGFSTHQFFLFDIYLINDGRYMTPVERTTVLAALQEVSPLILHTPILGVGTLAEMNIASVRDLLAAAKGSSIAHKIREGDVYKRMDGQFSFKAINNDFLAKEAD